MKRFLFLLLMAFSLGAKAQLYNNEWIDYSKTYYKFRVGVTGLIRIPQTALAAIGLDNTNADHFQVWRNGKEVPLYTTSTNGPLAANGYIEFWALMNDGKPDRDLYRVPESQLNDHFSLQTDSAAFFLTVNPLGNNLRLEATANDVTGNTLPAEQYFMHRVSQDYRAKFNPGRAELVGSSYTYSSSYDPGEGYVSTDIASGGTMSFTFSNLFAYMGAGAPAPVVSVNATGSAPNPRYFNVFVNGGDSILGQTMDYYDYAKVGKQFDIAKLTSGTAIVSVTNKGSGTSDRMNLARLELYYPHTFNLAGARTFEFELPANPSGNYLEITNFANTGVNPVLYDLTNGKRYVAANNNMPLRFKLLPSSVDRKLVLVSQSAAYYKVINTFEQRNFIDYSATALQGDYLIISNRSLVGPAGGSDPIEDYKQYRSSAAGGGYNVKVYLVDQLEDQFGLGIKRHPLSLRNFVRWARANFSAPIRNVLLIGKGTTYDQFRSNEANVNIDLLDLVPTFGHPASDNLITAVGSSSVPLTPIGRISVITRAEITDYLKKVKEYEQAQLSSSPNIADVAWKKNVVHVVGAGDNNTHNLLYAALNGHRAIIEDTFYAANVHSFSKTSADAVQQVSSVRLSNLFQNGIGILTYFGHSSSSTLEFNLDNPQAYNNQGKYPVMVVMGCNAGSFYSFNTARLTLKETISEKFVLAPDRGSVAFLASTHLGIIHYLDIYNTRQYNSMSNTKYGATLGEIMDETIKEVFDLTTENDFYARFHCEQFTLHGDPALRLYNFEKPDYAIEEPMINVDPKFIPVSQGEFKVTAKFVNLGKAINRKMVVELKRTYPNLTTEVIKRDTITFTKYTDSLTFTLPVVGSRDRGLNKITVTLDADNAVDELYETNNTITKDIYIIEDDVHPVFPYNYSIVREQGIKFVASTANPFADSRQYRMEIDTTEKFNSALLATTTVTSAGGVFELNPGITFTDSTVYYWRVSPVVASGEPSWNQYSFQYIANGEYGFSQAHYYQHQRSNKNKIRLNEDRTWTFDSLINNLFVKNGVWGSAISTEGELQVSVNDSSYIRSACGFNLVFNVFDEKSFIPWKNQLVGSEGMYSSVNPTCAASRMWNFEFPITQVGRNNAKNFLRNIVPDGAFVVFRFVMRNGTATQFAPTWLLDENVYGVGNSLYAELKTQGLVDLDSLNRPRALSFVYKKNRATEHAPRFIFSQGIFDPINLSVNCVTPNTKGTITSPRIGPAKEWKQLIWRGKSVDAIDRDTPALNLYGITANGDENLLAGDLHVTDQDFDISYIDAVTYPYVVLRMENVDTVNYTPYQLKYWMLTYNPVPEGAIAPNLYFTTKDTVEVGEPFNFGIAFKNVSKLPFDSVKVKVAITDRDNIENIIPIPRQKDLQPGDTIKLTVPVNTTSLSGMNTIFVNFNPDKDQPEEYLLNNYAFRQLYVRPDSLNPLMDVTFDGIHILNRDIVAAKPLIVAELKDEAKWMLLDDASLLKVKVRYPDGHERDFEFDNDTLQFIPATSSNANGNAAKINFRPYFTEDGEYELMVSGKDRSDNAAGAVQYRVSFQVINKPMISNMLNYPNPFTTSTAFVFTLTGAEVPQNLRIQILTITGKIVRDITKEELGPLHIGRNITEFKWDGTDQYGQKLANGIYLYRVITNLNGKSLDKYKASGDNTDKYFNKGYGKMYLMR